MAEEKEKKTYPMLPIGHWWDLRKKFKQSIPGIVTDRYLATVLDMQVGSARGNVLPYLKQLRIIDDEGKTLERARLWRDDEHYPEVCRAILKEVYPAELVEAVPDPVQNRGDAERWFAHQTGNGAVAIRKMTSFYALLVEADASKQPDEKDRKERPTRRPAIATPVPRATVPAVPPPPPPPPAIPEADNRHPQKQRPPDININLQVHISADSTSDQIDQIFASMAKHIYPPR